MIGDSIGKGVQARKQLKASKDALRNARDDRERAIWMSQQQDWNPEYASDHIGPYQRSQSPVADAFLDSLLTGDNAAAVQGTRAGASLDKGDAEQRFSQNYGGWEKLRAQQREMEAATPWDVKPIDRKVSQPDVSRYAWDASKAGGLSPEEMKQLEADGFKFNEHGKFSSKSGKTSKGAMATATNGDSGSADTASGRQYMRGLARARSEGLTLDEALALGPDELLRRGT